MRQHGHQNPYRLSDLEAASTRALPREFLYATGQHQRRRRGLFSPRTLLLLLVLMIGGLLALNRTDLVDEPLRMILGPLMIGIVVLLVAVALFDLIPRRETVQPVNTKAAKNTTAKSTAKHGGVSGLLLRVIDGDLEIAPTDAPKKALLRARLRDVRDVRLDTRQIRKVESAPEAGQFMTHQVGPELDVARIQLLIEGRDRAIPLTETFGSHMEAMEWMGKIRTFLRANDWLPEDERTRIPLDEEDDEEEDEEEEEASSIEEEDQPEPSRGRLANKTE